ncbi:DUF3047 domain-containing protein [Marinobacter sp. C2H3]|uniref:DUF3047 domain-containing protein n=1 Tax=Marinobacter sp. C2H3 TaxID=3119003 RepID=UPI00300EF31A
MTRTQRAVLCLGLSLSALALAAPAVIPPFSELTELTGKDSGWEPLEFPNISKHTRYALVTEGDQQVVRAEANGGASGLIARLSLAPGDTLTLSWRWKVSNVFEKGDARTKSGDDYPARVYVAFEFEPDKAGFFERAKRKAAEVLFGETLPGKALNYVWANTLPKGTFVPNAYTEDTMMVAVESGGDQAGQWRTESRDLVADYRKAFGEAPPNIVGVAIMTDSDNTGETATAWYGDLSLGQ